MIQTIIIQTKSYPLRRAFGRILLNTIGIALLLPGIALAGGTVQYVYDTLNRLTEARYDTGAILTYAYDDVGNRLTTSVTTQDTPDIAVFLGSTELLDVAGSYDFGRVTPQTSAAITLTITNTGAADLRLTGTPAVALTGNARQGFTVTQPGTSVIASGASTTCQVTFAPAQEGLHAVSLVIANNDVNEQAYTITLTGNGGDIGYLLWSK